MKKVILALVMFFCLTGFAYAQEIPPVSPLDFPMALNGDVVFYPLESKGNQFHGGIGLDVISYDKLLSLRAEATSAMQTKIIDKAGGGITLSLNRLAEKIKASWKLTGFSIDIGALWMFKLNDTFRGEPAGLLGVIKIPL